MGQIIGFKIWLFSIFGHKTLNFYFIWWWCNFFRFLVIAKPLPDISKSFQMSVVERFLRNFVENFRNFDENSDFFYRIGSQNILRIWISDVITGGSLTPSVDLQWSQHPWANPVLWKSSTEKVLFCWFEYFRKFFFDHAAFGVWIGLSPVSILSLVLQVGFLTIHK